MALGQLALPEEAESKEHTQQHCTRRYDNKDSQGLMALTPHQKKCSDFCHDVESVLAVNRRTAESGGLANHLTQTVLHKHGLLHSETNECSFFFESCRR